MDEQLPETKPKTFDSLTELYMENRRGMLECVDEYSYYRRLMESITIGQAILGNGSPLTKEIEESLKDEGNYLKQRNMDYKSSSRIYTCSTGDDKTGEISVRPEELKMGEDSLRNQQSNIIIKKLSSLDRRIFITLIEKGWIKKLSIDDTIEQDILKGLTEELDG